MTCCTENNVDSMLGNEILGNDNTLLENSGKRKKKFTGGNASKRHRDRVNIEFTNLAKLLPFSQSVIAKLDKSSILRLAVSFIRAKSFFKDSERRFEKRENASKNICKKEESSSPPPEIHLKEGSGVLSEIFSQALDGFLLVLTEDMKVLFVSESVRDYLGYCQAGIIHENFLQFVNPSDHPIIQSCLMYRKSEVENNKPYNIHQSNFHDRHMFNKEHLPKSFENVYNRNIARRRFVCRMKCAFSCSSRFYTAYRTFQFSGHLRRSTIQEGREQKHLNSLVVFAVPIPHSSSTSVEPTNEMMERSTTPLKQGPMENNDFSSYYERFGSGFRIEPTLRPHIAPIPVSRTDHTERQSPIMNRVRSCSLVDVPPLDMRQREYIYISRDSQPCITKSFSAPCSNESRYSDYSDDSKCSPASSPNLLWKKRPVSPYVAQMYNKPELNEQYRIKDAYLRRSISEQEYSAIKLRASPDAYEQEVKMRYREQFTRQSEEINRQSEEINRQSEQFNRQSIDLHHRYQQSEHNINSNRHLLDMSSRNLPDMSRNLPDMSRNLPDIAHYQMLERMERKRNVITSKDFDNLCNTISSVKRNKNQNSTSQSNNIQNGGKRYDFNISSLLGLDQKEPAKLVRDLKSMKCEEDVDVCKIEDENEKDTYRDILESMPRKLDLSYSRTLTPIAPHS